MRGIPHPDDRLPKANILSVCRDVTEALLQSRKHAAAVAALPPQPGLSCAVANPWSPTRGARARIDEQISVDSEASLSGGMARNTLNFKLVFLGDTGVGKSCLVNRFVRGEFLDYQESTIGAAFVTQTVALEDVTIKFEIWDTAGQERYRSLAPMYYRGATAAIVAFDVTSNESFNGANGAKTWVNELRRRGDENCVICLAGNKADLSGREVEADDAAAYARENNLLYVETSAKTGANVKEMFELVAKKLPRSRDVDAASFPLRDASAGRGGAKKDDSCCS